MAAFSDTGDAAYSSENCSIGDDSEADISFEESEEDHCVSLKVFADGRKRYARGVARVGSGNKRERGFRCLQPRPHKTKRVGLVCLTVLYALMYILACSGL